MKKLSRKISHTKWFKKYTLRQINASQQRYISLYPALKKTIAIFHENLKELENNQSMF